MPDRYHDGALTRWLEATFGRELVGYVVLGVPAAIGIGPWVGPQRAARDKD